MTASVARTTSLGPMVRLCRAALADLTIRVVVAEEAMVEEATAAAAATGDMIGIRLIIPHGRLFHGGTGCVIL